MTFADETRTLLTDFDTDNVKLTEALEIELRSHLDNLKEVVAEFSDPRLHVNLTHFDNSSEYKIKLSLSFSGRNFVTGDVDMDMITTYTRCVRKLVKLVENYKSDKRMQPERDHFQAGTDHDIVANRKPNTERITTAVAKGDYVDFRIATYPYEADVRNHIGRWVQRYPEVNAMIGTKLDIADIVEEVFLNAFERFDSRPNEVRFGDWLEQLIDPSIKLIVDHPDEEMRNISFARTIRGTR